MDAVCIRTRYATILQDQGTTCHLLKMFSIALRARRAIKKSDTGIELLCT